MEQVRIMNVKDHFVRELRKHKPHEAIISQDGHNVHITLDHTHLHGLYDYLQKNRAHFERAILPPVANGNQPRIIIGHAAQIVNNE